MKAMPAPVKARSNRGEPGAAAGGEDQHGEEGHHGPEGGEHQRSLDRGPQIARFSWFLVCQGDFLPAGRRGGTGVAGLWVLARLFYNE